ncbi:hypothetical protein SCAR479_13597 [Seiridium cardinale]|uniref:Transcription initiation factor TFIID subunit 2 n=1 Tax=Seiridium cardinale TaxID=138064 RepID=A0ABR2X7F8_9PEZI
MPATLLEADPAIALDVEPELLAEPELLIDDTPPRPYTVFHEHVALDLDLHGKSVTGHVDIFISSKEALKEVFIDARQSQIDARNITVSYARAEATYDDPYEKADTPDAYQWSAGQWPIRKQRMQPLMYRHLKNESSAMQHEEQLNCHTLDGSVKIAIPPIKDIQASMARQRELRTYVEGHEVLDQWVDQYDKMVEDNMNQLYKISIPFSLRNIRDGLHFVGIDEGDTRYPHLYTRHSVEPGLACSIFPCIDDPGCRSSWRVSLTFPRTLGDAFHQRLVTQQQPVNGTATANSNKKRKHDDKDHQRPSLALTEEDKLLELTAVCSGKLEDEVVNQRDETKKTMVFSCNNKAARHIGFALGPFEHVDLWSEFRTEEDDEKLGSNATKVHGYCLPGRAEVVQNSCAAIVNAMDHFALTYGRYPFDNYKMCFVDDMVDETVPLCGFSLCSNRLLFPREIIDHEVEVARTLVHALASQWFGINIIPSEKSDIWLVVGIAWFMTDLYLKSLCGNNWYRFRMKDQGDHLVQIDFNRPSLEDLGNHLHLGDFEVNFMSLKANLVLFILDRRLSKSSRSAGIARIIAKMIQKANTSSQSADEILTSDMFRKACEKHGQTRLEGFWKQWIKSAGCPRFDVHQKFNKKQLCVEITIRQIQDIAHGKARQLEKDDFWREIVEDNHGVYAAELQHCFTGPMTIRVHEADGTPYEHGVDIRDDTGKSIKFNIPYNTKYKRLKRSRRQKERQTAGNTAATGEEDVPDESLIYCLGDVLQNDEDITRWGLTDWDPEMEARMDQESYEWIRMDADFEWVCMMVTNMQPYMYVSQLQQDRDVVAHQDSMLYLDRESIRRPHPLISTILTRTLVDERYYHDVRTMAAKTLSRLGVDALQQVGLKHLMQSFDQLYGFGNGHRPRPNDFSNRSQYIVQCAIPGAISRIRDKEGNCPKEARRFILQQLQGNNNTDNPYSDQLYICKLINALATCLIPDEDRPKKPAMSFSFGDRDDEEESEADPEPQEFKEMALEEIDRFRRTDEYSPSFHNCFTVAALDALYRLMKARVVPLDPVVFTQYLQDWTIEDVRIKAFEALVELKFITKPVFLKFFLSVIATDRSPYVRDRLFKILCRGLASIAIGEHEAEAQDAPAPSDDLVVEAASSILEAKQKLRARKEKLPDARAALKEITKDDEALQEYVWKALDSVVLTVAERRNFLELCSILFEEDDRFVVRFDYPKVWTCERGAKERARYFMNFKRHYRTKSRKTYAAPAIARPEAPKRTITLNLNKASSFKEPTPTTVRPPTGSFQQAAQAPKPSIPAKPAEKPAAPNVTKPNPPKPSMPKLSAPKPSAPKPSAPKPSAPKPSAPKPSAPKPSAPKPSLLQPSGSPPPKEIRKDSISVQTPRPSIEVPVSAPERKALPGTFVKPQQTPKPQAPKVMTPKVQMPKVQTTQSPAPSLPKPNGDNRSSSLAPPPPKTLKRTSAEPEESERPRKIVKLSTKGIPHEKLTLFKERSKIIKIPFRRWDKIKLRKQPSATPEAGTIRATPKGPPSHKERTNSIVVGSPVGANSPKHPTPTSAPGSRMSPQVQSGKKSATPPTQPQSSSGSVLKPVRKPLPGSGPGGGERKPLPFGARTSLPSASPQPSSTSSSFSVLPAPKPSKLKIMVKKPKPPE